VDSGRERGVTSWISFIGRGTPRYVLPAAVDPPRPHLARLLINFTDRDDALAAAPELRRWLEDRHPGVHAVVRPLGYGPPVDAPVAVRIASDRDRHLFALADTVRHRLRAMPGTRDITDDWGPRVKTLVVDVDQDRALRAGVTSADVALGLRTGVDGLAVTEYRAADEPIPVLLRTGAGRALDLGRLATLEIGGRATGRQVTLGQVADLQLQWQPPVIHRRDRVRTITVSAHLTGDVTAAAIAGRLEPVLAAAVAGCGPGTSHEYGGEVEASREANASIYARLPLAFLAIVLLLVLQFDHLKQPLIILLTIPLALIGVVAGLWLLDGVLGFMTLLGVISLAGIVINNAIVLLQRIGLERTENQRSPADAVIAAAQQRLRPILLTTGTTVGGLLPLYLGGGPLWESLAITIICGLLFATVLTLGVVPVLYALLEGIRFDQVDQA
jgi:multidrug efflux pump subunit AcrB